MTVQAGDRVILFEKETGRRWLVHLDGAGARKEKGLGVFDPARLEGAAWGEVVDIAGRSLHLFPPTLPDLHATLRRKAQIILAKDLGMILFDLGLRSGDRVLESGIGSGAATIALLDAVGPEGEVVVQELRDDFADWAQKNAQRTGKADWLSIHIGDLTQSLAAGIKGPFHGCLLDQPEPWLAVPHVAPELAPGARLIAYCPQVSQMEKTVHRLRDEGFLDVQSKELIERAWEVKERGSRPAFEGIGHTGFLVSSRWPGPA